uniref:Uncharacterized protein n=1 Tax=Oryctolagus cuniculus TaxID=9986 RepID=A0A5F9CHB3_RABIT
MFSAATQRPTEKTAAPCHPFFIGSRPEPVFRGGISSPRFGCRQRLVGYCARREESAPWSIDLSLGCWLCTCLWGPAQVLTGL